MTRARFQRSFFSSVSAIRPSKGSFHRCACAGLSRVTRSSASAARLATASSSSHRHSTSCLSLRVCRRSCSTTSQTRPGQPPTGPSRLIFLPSFCLTLLRRHTIAAIVSCCGLSVSQALRGHTAHAAQYRFQGPVAFRVREANLAHAAHFRPVVPALEQCQMPLAHGGSGSFGGRRQRRQHALQTRFEHAASGLCWSFNRGCASSRLLPSASSPISVFGSLIPDPNPVSPESARSPSAARRASSSPTARSGFACRASKIPPARAIGRSQRERQPLRPRLAEACRITARSWLNGRTSSGASARTPPPSAPAHAAPRPIRIPDWPKPGRARVRSTTSWLSPRVARKLSHRRGLFGVALVGAALVAGREAHLHLRVDAAGMARIGIQIVGAAAQQKQLQRLFGKALRRRARSETARTPNRPRAGWACCVTTMRG